MMMPERATRSFKGGSWDLRKQERRENQTAIGFPDRRQVDRRAGTNFSDSTDPDLTWVRRPRLDE
jgi:hypothetical protein